MTITASNIPLSKLLKTEDDVRKFGETASYKRIRDFIEECAAAVEGVKGPCTEVTDTPYKGLIKGLTEGVFPALRDWVKEIPLHDMKQQRFGNKAFRDFFARLDQESEALLAKHVLPALSSSHPDHVAGELRGYFLDSFGNAQRIDYGTGHELHFFIFLYAATLFIDSPDAAARKTGLKELILVAFTEYMSFCRLIQSHYSLEPAGSHGVWGLDDYHHLPFIFGASQLMGTEPTLLPKHIQERAEADKVRGNYMFFDMIGWIYDNKKGPFFEHSPTLYNISDIDKWERIRRGMFKMHAGEVMAKFAVMQHFLFGKIITVE